MAKIWIAVGVVAVLVIGLVAFRGDKQDDGMMDEANPSASTSPKAGTTGTKETTAKGGTYKCAGGKTFTLAVQADGTARVTGASSSNVVLKKSDTLGIWQSSDAKVAVRQTAGYTILVENDVTTRDLCYL